jgi:hypothetical protein
VPHFSAIPLLRESTSPTTALFLLDNRYRCRDELDTAGATSGQCVQLAVVVEVILAVELVFAVELTGESVRALSVETGRCYTGRKRLCRGYEMLTTACAF